MEWPLPWSNKAVILAGRIFNGMPMGIATYIDHTILRPTTTGTEVGKLCQEAIQYGFAAVCLPPPGIGQARQYLSGSPVKIATVIGFPFGYSVPHAKLVESEEAITAGADELDVVINLMALKAGDWVFLEKEMEAIIVVAHRHEKFVKVKVIIECGLLSPGEIVDCCKLYGGMGADFVKTSTGYAEKGASVADVRLMREELPPSVKIKASGGIRTYAFARELIGAGAARLGCSGSVGIVREEEAILAGTTVSGQD